MLINLLRLFKMVELRVEKGFEYGLLFYYMILIFFIMNLESWLIGILFFLLYKGGWMGMFYY